MEGFEKIKVRKILALILVIMTIFNLFSPYAILGYWQDENGQDKYSLLNVSKITKASGGNYMFSVEYAVIDDVYAGSFDISLKYNTDLFAPANKSTGASSTKIAQTSTRNSDYFTFQTSTFSNGTIRMVGTTTDWYNAAEGEGVDDTTYGTKISIFQVYFYIKDPSMWKLDGSQEITTDMISWAPTASSQTGYKQRIADDYDGNNPKWITDLNYVTYTGFKQEDEPEIVNIEIIKNPDKMTYVEDELLNFEGGKVKLTYNDDPENPTVEELSIEDAISSGKITASSTNADNTKIVTFSAGTSATTDLKYYLLDNISLKTNISNNNYEHGDTIDFSGGIITATYNDVDGNNTTQDITIASEISNGTVTVDMTKADVHNQTVIATYYGKTVNIPLTVTDPIDRIEITTTPTNVEYNHGNTISPAGGVIKAVRRSGDEVTDISMSSSDVSISPSLADINSCTSKWQNGSMQAGNQTITVNYEGKQTTYDVVVNDTISGITVKNGPTAKNKYGTAAGSLDYTGAVITVTTSSGNTFDTNVSAGMVDTTSYNPNVLTVQNLPVTYAGQTTQANSGINITLLDYINGITVSAPSGLSVNYNDELDLSNVTYVKNYASGFASASIPVTQDMIAGGFNKTPSSSSFNSNHECAETVTVKLSNPDDSDIDMVPVTDTFNVTIKDTLSGIKIVTNPTKVNFDYSETFSAAGGRIQELYASGAIGSTVSMTNSEVSVTELDGSSVSTTPSASEFTNEECRKNVLVKYKNYTAQYQIKILDTVSSISINTDPKDEFYHGNTFEVGSGKLNVQYSSGTTDIVSMTDSNVSITQEDGSAINMSPNANDYDNTYKYVETLLVEYKDAQVSYPITIINDVREISVHTTPKTNYNINDSLDLTTDGTNYGEIKVKRAVGTDEIIPMNDSRVAVTGFASATENTSLPLTVTFTENGISKTTSYNVEVKDTVTSIAIKTVPTKVDYKYNEELDVTGGEIEITKGSGTTTIPMTASMVTGYTKTDLGEQTLTVTYGGKTDTYKVTVKDYVTKITLNPDTVTGTVKDTLLKVINDNNIKYSVVYAKAGSTTPVDLVNSMVTGYSDTVTTAQTLTVTYTDNDTDSFTNGSPFTANLNVTLSDAVSTITVTKPNKVQYKHGESLDVTGGTITVTTVGGATKTVQMTTAMIKESDGTAVNMTPTYAEFASDMTLSKTLKIEYTEDGKTGTVNYPITIINDVREISVHTTPKTNYNVNDSLDLTTDGTNYGEIKVKRAVGTDEIIPMNDSRVAVTGFASVTENTSLPLTVSYTENGITKNTSYNVSIKDSVSSIAIKNTPKQNYKYNEPLDVTGGKITVTKGSGTVDIDIEPSMVKEEDGSEFDSTKLGTRKLKVTYGGQTAEYEVTIKDYVTGITVSPNSITGKYNDELSSLISAKNVKYTVTYAKAGAQTPVALIDAMVPGYNKDSVEEQNLKVKYTDNDTESATKGEVFEADFTVTLSDTVESIEIKAPSKTEYKHGENLLANGTITVNFAKGSPVNRTMTTAMIFENDGITEASTSPASYDSTNKTNKTLKITYAEGGISKTIEYPITIINDIREITVYTTPKTNYNVNDSLDLTTDGTNYGEIKVKRAVGTDSIISMSDTNVSVTGFNSGVENTALPLTVSYTENGITKQTTYNVSVKDSVTSIAIKNKPKQNYKYNEELDVTGGKITVTKGSGTVDIDIEPSMVKEEDGSEFDSTKLGTRKLKVTYGGQTAEYEVTIKDYVTGITVSPNSITGKYNDELSSLISAKNVKYTVTYAKAGAQTPVALIDAMVPGYNKDSVEEQNLKVKYTDNDTESATKGEVFEADFTVTLSDTVESIEIKAPSKTEYKHGENLLANGTITVNFAKGSPVNRTMTTAMIFENDGITEASTSPASYDSTNKTNKTLKITYAEGGISKTIEYPITIINDIREITVYTTPKTNYNVNDSLDLTTDGTNYGEIKVKRAVGTDEIILMNDSRVAVTGFTSATENTSLPLTVSYTENGITKNTSYNVSIKDSVSSIAIKNTPKQNYKYNEPLDVTGGKITVTKGSGTVDIDIEPSMVKEEDGSEFDSTKLGTRKLKVTYGGQTAEYEVTIKDYVTEITVSPDNVTGTYNDELSDLISANNVKYTVTYAKAGAKTPVALAESMVNEYNKTSTSSQELTVTYTDNDTDSFTNGSPFTATLNVTLKDNVNSISITGEPTEALYGEELDLSTLVITANKDSGTQTIETSEATISGYDKNKLGMQTITVEYGGKSTNFDVEVKDYIADINLVAPTKNRYNWSTTETLDLTGGSVQTVMASGAKGMQVPLDDSQVTVSTFIPNKEGKQTITVTYEGKTKTFDVNVIDEISNIVIKNPPTTVDYGHDIDLSGTTIQVIKNSGTTTIPVTEDMLSNYDSTDLSGIPQTITVTYEGKTDTFDITVNDYLVDIVLTAPSKNTYEYGESLDISDGYITKVTASGASDETVKLQPSMISGYDNTKLGAQTVTVTYEGITKTFGVTVEDNIQKIEVKEKPKTKYNYGEGLDVTGGTITVTRSSGTSTVNITPSMVSGFNPNKLGTQTLTVTYGGKTAKYDVNVEDYIDKITIDNPNKLVYKLNEPLDLTGGKVKVIMASGAIGEITNMTASMVSGFDSSTTGAKSLKVSYKGKNTTFGITVVDELAEMSINTLPKVDYLYGEKMDLAGGTIKLTRESGAEEIIPMTAKMISGFTTKTTAEQVLVTVTYEGLQDTFYINVTDYEVGAELVKPNKKTYEYGQDLDLTGGLIIIRMASGTVKEETALTGSMVSGFDSTILGSQKLTVNYKGYTKNFDITVVDTIGGIAVNTEPNKTKYQYGENIDVTGGTIKVIKTSGTTIKNITPEMISGYNPNVVGNQVITVTYEGFTTQFSVLVEKENDTPSTPGADDGNGDEAPSTPGSNNGDGNTTPSIPGSNNGGGNTTPSVPNSNTRPSKRPSNTSLYVPVQLPNNDLVEEPQEEPKQEIQKPQDESNVPPVIGNTEDNQNLPGNWKEIVRNMLLLLLGLLALAGIILIIIVLAKRRKNVKIYLEEGGEKVLVGKEKVTKNNRVLDLNKYYDKYKEDEYRIVLSKSISKKLDQKTVNLTVHDKKESFVVDYKNKACSYRT